MPKYRVNHKVQRQLREEQEDTHAYAKRLKAEERDRLHITHVGQITRCSKCPPKHCCPTCARINNARQRAGLLRPSGDPRPSPSNTMYVCLQDPHYRGARLVKFDNKPAPVVTAYIKHLGGGWRKGAAMLNGKDIYVQPKATRSMDEAWDYAGECAKLIKWGLESDAD